MKINIKYIQGGLIVLLAVIVVNKFLPSRNIKGSAPNNSFNAASQSDWESYPEEPVDSQSNNTLEPLAQAGLDYYLEKSGDDPDSGDIESRIENFGCHSEVHIYKDGELVMRLAYFGGQMFEL
ncbi:hypothetical protein [Cellulosilyticum sp. I15G10I2]|uniref:hypothetical protein n=1 Tax=Cellulosilyticum sp. I15G10I2 TaxID=1892843 RepID=UPI00085BB77E|nr:hypothetical protein [Cellulosilyticum sp. I15G10I2]